MAYHGMSVTANGNIKLATTVDAVKTIKTGLIQEYQMRRITNIVILMLIKPGADFEVVALSCFIPTKRAILVLHLLKKFNEQIGVILYCLVSLNQIYIDIIENNLSDISKFIKHMEKHGSSSYKRLYICEFLTTKTQR